MPLERWRREPEQERAAFVSRLQQRDPAAWEQLFLAWSGRLFAYALHTTGDPAVAQDIMSETFARAYRDIDRFGRRGSAVGAWLRAIAHHRLADFQRQQARTHHVALDAAANVPAKAGLNEQPFVHDLSPDLLTAIERLPGDQRAVVILRFILMLSGEETAATLGKSHGAVRQLQFRALRNLRAALAHP